MGEDLHNVGKVIGIEILDSGNTALDGHTHIVAGVAVGNGEYVELVDLFCIGAKLVCAASYHLGEE